MLALDTIYKASTVLSDVVCRTNVIHEESSIRFVTSI